VSYCQMAVLRRNRCLTPSASSIVCNPPVTMPCSFCSNQVLLKAAGTTTHANSPTRPTPRLLKGAHMDS
jgi:hypothetical protein